MGKKRALKLARRKERSDPKTEQVHFQKPPMNPYVVLMVAICLPGVGQVINNYATRGLVMIFFMLVGAWICFNTTTPEHSFLGRYAAGWFVYAISIFDAYKWARYRYELYNYQSPNDSEA